MEIPINGIIFFKQETPWNILLNLWSIKSVLFDHDSPTYSSYHTSTHAAEIPIKLDCFTGTVGTGIFGWNYISRCSPHDKDEY